jgi:FlaA1/EpsC-like NDP-sugar epimerase
MVLMSLICAVLLRFEGSIPPTYQTAAREFWMPAAIVIVNLAIYWWRGLYSRVWRYAGVHELKSIFLAVVIAYVPFVLLSFVSGGAVYSRSIIIIAALVNVMLVGGMRFALRLVNEPITPPRLSTARRVLIVGTSDQSEAILRELQRHPTHAYFPVGFVELKKADAGMTIRGTPVLGTLDDVPRLIEAQQIDEVILGLSQPTLVRRLVTLCEGSRQVELKLVPSISDVMDGRTTVSQIREVRIEDLLERDPVSLQLDTIAGYIKGKRVLVTGAGGSIGSEICRQISRLGPERMILLGRGENSIHEIAVELRSRSTVPLHNVIADVRDRPRLARLFEEEKPQVVFHAAAHKHVPLMEANPSEAVTVNVLGTRNLVELSAQHRIERFILLSTDKAVNPSSMMGASKRVAEWIVQDAARAVGDAGTRFVAVRFGNVLGSRGSVIPTFKRQIALGGPVTVTHADMTRFFMTIPEAVALVIQAAALATGGDIYILDMGQPVRILDLARNMIRLSGYEPEVDIPIQFLGVREGEKMSEELVGEGEQASATAVNKIQRITGDTMTPERLSRMLSVLEQAAAAEDEAAMREILGLSVPQPKYC